MGQQRRIFFLHCVDSQLYAKPQAVYEHIPLRGYVYYMVKNTPCEGVRQEDLDEDCNAERTKS